MINKIKYNTYMLGFLMSMSYVVAMAQERRVGDIVTFEIGCPKIKHEVLPQAITPHLNNMTRLDLGVCEKVKLWLEKGNKKVKGTWIIKQGAGILTPPSSPNDTEWIYEAPLDPGTIQVILEAQPETKTCVPLTERFNIVAPTAIVFRKSCGYHTENQYDVGLLTKQVSLLPDHVSFAYLSIKELEAYAKGTGDLSSSTGLPHGASGVWGNCVIIPIVNIGKVEKDLGTLINMASRDDAWMEVTFQKIPLNPIGTVTYVIPWVYAKSTDLTQERRIQRVLQQGTISGITLKMQKSTEFHNVTVPDPGLGRVDCK
jgi:hypothetical protein